MDVWFLGGAFARVAPDSTAFHRRSDPYLLGIEANWTDAKDDAANVAWARELFEAAHGLGVKAGEPGLTASSLEGLARTWVDEDPEQSGALEREAADVRERLGRPRPHYQDGWRPGGGPAAGETVPSQAPHPTS